MKSLGKEKNIFLDEKVVTLKEFVKLYENNSITIKNSKILPPQLGEPGFGKIKVTFLTKVFEGVVKP